MCTLFVVLSLCCLQVGLELERAKEKLRRVTEVSCGCMGCICSVVEYICQILYGR